MSKSRHSSGKERTRDRTLVRTFGLTFHSRRRFTYPAPGWDQLIHVTEGSLTVHSGGAIWVLAAQRALWMPSGVEHEIQVPGPAALRSLYFHARAVRTLPRVCCPVNISPLLRELIARAVGLGALDGGVPEQRRLAGVLMDQMKGVSATPLQLPMPLDSRARRAAGLMLGASAPASIGELARMAGASARTLERLFRAETGLPAGMWIRRARLLRAVQALAAGSGVATAAAECGYSSASAFVSMFRREMGSTPGHYFEPPGGPPREPVAIKRKNG